MCGGSDSAVSALFLDIKLYAILTFESSSVADIELAARLTFGRGHNDLNLVPVPYRDVKLPEKLRLGYYSSGILHTCPFRKHNQQCTSRELSQMLSSLRASNTGDGQGTT